MGESDALELTVSVRSEWVGEAARFRVRAEDGSVSEFVLMLGDLPVGQWRYLGMTESFS